jgi:hypothetical protein
MCRNAGISSRHARVLVRRFDDMLQDYAGVFATAIVSLWSCDLLEKFRLLRIGKQRIESTEGREPGPRVRDF